MDFSWTKEQLALKARIVEFTRTQLEVDDVERDRESVFSHENWRRCADFGLLAMSLPKEYTGKDDIDFLTAILAMEGLGYGCKDNGLAFALNAQMWTVQLPVLHFGSDELKAHYLPAMSRGELIGAHAISEPESGSDVFSMQTTATRCEGGYRLNGEKRYVSLGPVADLALVFALTDPDAGKWGVSAFLVEVNSDGLEVSPNREKMGLRTVPFGDFSFNDCFVPEGNRLGPEGAGMSLSTSFLEWERCSILASQIGTMQRQLEECIRYVRKREQFGKAIGKYQSVSNRIVDMRLRVETSRLLLYHTAWLKQCGKSAMAEAAMLKLHLGECFVESSLDAIRVHGAHGYVSESGIERNLRDSVGGVIYAGTSDIQRNIVARMLGL
ncbi:MAG: acyl-CoA dehydrogenase family protein [Gammaproteobacteria bacterium]